MESPVPQLHIAVSDSEFAALKTAIIGCCTGKNFSDIEIAQIAEFKDGTEPKTITLRLNHFEGMQLFRGQGNSTLDTLYNPDIPHTNGNLKSMGDELGLSLSREPSLDREF